MLATLGLLQQKSKFVTIKSNNFDKDKNKQSESIKERDICIIW